MQRHVLIQRIIGKSEHAIKCQPDANEWKDIFEVSGTSNLWYIEETTFISIVIIVDSKSRVL